MAAIREEGSLSTVVSAFPSVTGVAYTPFLLGRYPGRVGLPGLRWYDRTRRLGVLSGHARSYAGPDMRLLDDDLEPAAPTLFELVPGRSLGAMSVISRGLPAGDRVGRSVRYAARAAWTHFRGDVAGWLTLDRLVGDEVVARTRRDRPRFVFAAFAGVDKASHAGGHDSALVLDALRTVDAVAEAIRRDAERDGRWKHLHLWIVSDHGHSRVDDHDDLVRVLGSLGIAVRSHPWAFLPGGDVAVMVSGNSMAHLYLELHRRERPFWPALRDRWEWLIQALARRPSVDLIILPVSSTRAEVHGRGRGTAAVERRGNRFSYLPIDGDPLGAGVVQNQCADGALEATLDSEYPDSIVQIAELAAAPRSGDIFLSASRGCDFRDRYEPIRHHSSHGALHAEHMRVPLLLSRPSRRQPLRTVDVMPSALRAMGAVAPPGLDGCSFL